jgi:hypothetical protein
MKIRKIISKENSERKTKRNQLILGIIMILVMFFSVVGYSFSVKEKEGSNEKMIYNGTTFTKESGLWNTNIGSFKFSFKYNPKEVENVSAELNLLKSYSGKPLYFSANGAEAEIARNFFYQNQIVQRVQYACLEEEECIMKDYPVKTCQDNFIIIKESSTNEIKQQQNCLFISGKKEDLIKLTDSVLFKIIGIQ